jgi:hypothetical protein
MLPCLTTSCQSTTTGNKDRPGARRFVDLSKLNFKVETVTGQVQIKRDRNSPWEDLAPGTEFNGFALIRSGFRSNAELTLTEGSRTIPCEVDDLICATSMNDIYDKVLCEESLSEYYAFLYDAAEPIDFRNPVRICRDTLDGYEQPTSMLASSSMVLSARTLQQGGSGAAGAAAGGSGGGGGGGGCSGGS